MKVRPEHYLGACQERIEDARRLHEIERYVSSIYLAGVAVECLLRAYATRADPAFDSHHDLHDLRKMSGISEFIPARRRQELAAALGDVWSRWRNNYRYASEELLRAELRRRQLDRGIKGDWLKKNSAVTLEAAFDIVSIGVRRWTSRTK